LNIDVVVSEAFRSVAVSAYPHSFSPLPAAPNPALATRPHELPVESDAPRCLRTGNSGFSPSRSFELIDPVATTGAERWVF
jgi:hypothetical protein